ncbi:hypothetical protein Lalb_Chr14g0365871 [Lupinus albus]|uniref:Uncharacterized protein n=1 Tax=Lupinus albus TaxID=3870 RepID=A0A6A4P9I0_LUPAL|nr:hypothetical protein Lalb_Chr14g0365871 [Lupinus albus]
MSFLIFLVNQESFLHGSYHFNMVSEQIIISSMASAYPFFFQDSTKNHSHVAYLKPQFGLADLAWLFFCLQYFERCQSNRGV